MPAVFACDEVQSYSTAGGEHIHSVAVCLNRYICDISRHHGRQRRAGEKSVEIITKFVAQRETFPFHTRQDIRM